MLGKLIAKGLIVVAKHVPDMLQNIPSFEISFKKKKESSQEDSESQKEKNSQK